MTTNVPTVTFGPNGPVAPTESAILVGRQADINAAFGGVLNPGLSTPQGQLASSETAIIGNANDSFLYLASMFDPAYSQGRYQDALGRIYFLQRNPSQPTVVQGLCTGLSGVAIPVNAKAVAADGNIYLCTAAGTIGASGTVTLPFACSVPGPIPCPAGSLSEIYQAVLGWDTITNVADGTLGNNVESRTSFEARRKLSVAQNAVGINGAILGNVLGVANVIDAYVTENPTNYAQLVGGVQLLANSIFVSVIGGASTDIANAIFAKKPPGCAYTGNTAVQVQDTSPGYSPPYPSYTVTYETAVLLPILMTVTIVNSPAVPPNAAALIQAAVISAAAGGDGGPRVRIGSTVYASRYYCPIAALGTWAQIVSIKVGTTAANLDDVPLTIAQYPSISAGNINVMLQ